MTHNRRLDWVLEEKLPAARIDLELWVRKHLGEPRVAQNTLPCSILSQLLLAPRLRQPLLLVPLDLLCEPLVDLDLDVVPPASPDPGLGLLVELVLDLPLPVLLICERVGNEPGGVVKLERNEVTMHVWLEGGRADEVVKAETRREGGSQRMISRVNG